MNDDAHVTIPTCELQALHQRIAELEHHNTLLQQREQSYISQIETLQNDIRNESARFEAELAHHQRELHMHNEQFHLIADFTYDWEYWRTLDGTFAYMSPSCERITGYTAEEFLGTPNLFLHIIHPDDRARVELHITEEQSSYLGPCTFEFRIKTKNGQERWIGHSCQAVFRTDGRQFGRRASNRDITERKWVETVLHVQHSLALALGMTTNLTEALAYIIYTALGIDKGLDSGSIYHFDQHTTKLKLMYYTGFTEQFLCQYPDCFQDQNEIQAILQGKTLYYNYAYIEQFCTSHLRDEGLHAMTLLPVRHDGTVVAVIILASHTIDNIPPHTRSLLEAIAAQVGGIISRIETETALDESRCNLVAIFDAMDDFMFVMNRDGQLLHWNPAVENYLGYTAYELHTMTLHDMHAPDQHEIIASLLSDTVAGTAVACIPLLLATKNGHFIPVETRVTSGAWHKQDALFAISRDISERVQAEEALRAAYNELEHRVDERTTELAKANNVLHEEIAERLQAEEALRQSEERYREISDLISDLVYSLQYGANGSIVREWGFNGFDTLTGYTLDELSPDEWNTIVYPEDRSLYNEHVRRLEICQPSVSEYRIITKDGATRWLRDHGRPVCLEPDQHLVRIYGAVKDVTVYKAAGIALRESEERFRQLTENIRQVFWMRDSTKRKILYVSPAYEYLWMRSCQSLYAEPVSFMEPIHPEDKQQVVSAFSRYMQGHDFDEEFRIVLPDGSFRWVWSRDFPIHNDQGVIYRYAGIAEDITVRKQAEESLRQREQVYRTMFEKNTAMKLLVDPDTSAIVDANSAAAALYGYPVETLRKMYLTDISLSTIEDVMAALRDGASEHRDYFIVRHRIASGEVRDIEIYSGPIEIGQRTLLYVILFDITERKRAEARQSTQLAVTRVLAEAATVADAIPRLLKHLCIGLEWQVGEMWHTNLSTEQLHRAYAWYASEMTNTVFVEQSATHTFPADSITTSYIWNREHTSHTTHAEHIPPPFIRATLAEDVGLSCCFAFPVGSTLECGCVLCFYSTDIYHLDSTLFEMMTDVGSQITQFLNRKQIEEALSQERLSLARRVEERTAELSIANAELARAVRTKDEFLANMSHELRTPLNAVLGLTESLQEFTYGTLNDRQLRTLQTIETSGRHLLSLINDILDLSKIEAGKMELHIDAFSIDVLCQASLQFVKQLAKKKNIQVSLQLVEKHVTMHADMRRLKQVLVNLLSNAVKFTPEGGVIGLDVVCNEQQESVHFTIWDTGIGIASDDLARLFKAFVQIDSSLSRQHEGTGLGLALVQRLVDMHGGSIGVVSEPGEGSRFTVSLPLHHPNMQPERDQPPSVTEPEIPTVCMLYPETTIVLAEDNEATIHLVREYLRRKGYRVVIARNGIEAIERTREERPALVLMDIHMPQMDGLDAIQHIRLDGEIASVPIIAVTALAMPGDRERCFEAGANGYISKPVNLKELLKMIQEYVQE